MEHSYAGETPGGLKTPMKRGLPQQVSQEIGIRILTGQYAPGDTLGDEPSLAQEFGVSRTVIREAVRVLISKGMLDVRPRIGMRVQEPRKWQILDHEVLEWKQAVPLADQHLSQLIELRLGIEPLAARLAASRRTQEDMSAIRKALQAMQDGAGRNSDYVMADAGFHAAVLRAAHNRYFDALENAIYAGLLLSIRITNPGKQQNLTSLPFHQSIADAIEAGEPETAQKEMERHLADSAARLELALSAIQSS